jgi:hypothetical protein
MILKMIKNILIFCAVFLLSIAAIDLFVKYAAINPVSIYSYEPGVGRTFRSNIEYFYTTEGLSAGTTNEFGYLGAGYPPQKQEGVLRIALLGDSYIEGFQLFDRHHFRSILEKELNEKYGINAEVMNFGRSGFDLSDMYAYNVNFVSRFNPDIVLYFADNGDYVQKANEEGMPYPYLEKDSLKMFYYKDTGEGSMPWFLSLNKMSLVSPMVQIVRNCINLYKKGETAAIIFGKFYEPFSKQQELDYTPAPHPGEVQKKILEQLGRSHSNIIVNRDKQDISPVIKPELQRTGVSFIDLNNALYPLKNSGVNPYLWKYNKKEGHWNHQAHEVVGKFLAVRIVGLYK